MLLLITEMSTIPTGHDALPIWCWRQYLLLGEFEFWGQFS